MSEEKLTPETLLESLKNLYENKDSYIHAMESSAQSSAIDIIMDLIRGEA